MINLVSARRFSRLALMFAGSVVLIVLAWRFALGDAPVHNELKDAASKVIGEFWRIEKPPVRQRQTDYPEITFRPGDEVLIEADGCVNTGGRGKTTKRYVNPKGPNSDRLYSGLVWVPALDAGLVRIGTVGGRSRIIPFGAPHDAAQMFLRLGYEDDDYSDNSYDKFDDGTDDQCKGVGPAYVTIKITHHEEPPPPPEKPKAPMDLWWDAVDDNLLPLNPRWGYQVPHPGELPDAASLCNNFHNEGDRLNLGNGTTQKVSTDEASGFNALICHMDKDHPPGTVHGHVNWGCATYTGTIRFCDWQVPFPDSGLASLPGDNDYDMALFTTSNAGITTGKIPCRGHDVNALGVEFNASETINNFNTPWWIGLRQAARQYPSDKDSGGAWTANNLDGHDAIVVALVGIDTQHGAHAELHPAYALAINTMRNAQRERWAFFVRNWGNEGFCSQEIHELPLNKINLFFPNVQAVDNQTSSVLASSPECGWGSRFFSAHRDNAGAQISPPGVLLSVRLAAPGQHSFVYGELEFTRVAGSPGSLFSPMGTALSRTARVALGHPEIEDADAFHRLMVPLTGTQKSRLETELRRLPSLQPFTAQAVVLTQSDSLVDRDRHAYTLKPSEVRMLPLVAVVRTEPDSRRIAYQARVLDTLKQVVGSGPAWDEYMTNVQEGRPPAQKSPPRPKGKSKK